MVIFVWVSATGSSSLADFWFYSCSPQPGMFPSLQVASLKLPTLQDPLQTTGSTKPLEPPGQGVVVQPTPRCLPFLGGPLLPVYRHMFLCLPLVCSLEPWHRAAYTGPLHMCVIWEAGLIEIELWGPWVNLSHFLDGLYIFLSTSNLGSIPGSRISPRVGNGNPLPVFLLRKSHGQRSLVCYSPRGCIELDTAEQLTVHFMTSISKRV